MRFVDGEKRQRQAFEPGGGVGQGHTFRREIHQAIFPRGRALEGTAAVLPGESAIDKGCRNADLFKLNELVLHQRDQRRNHYGGSLGIEDCRQLVTERFAAARGHHHARIATRRNAAHNGLLPGTECSIAPIAAKRLCEGSGGFVHDFGFVPSVRKGYGRARSILLASRRVSLLVRFMSSEFSTRWRARCGKLDPLRSIKVVGLLAAKRGAISRLTLRKRFSTQRPGCVSRSGDNMA